MKIKMLRNLGLGWPDAAKFREGTEHEVFAMLGNRLAAAGLCEVLERDRPPEPAPKAAPQPIEPPAVKAPAAPQQQQPTQKPQSKRGR